LRDQLPAEILLKSRATQNKFCKGVTDFAVNV